MDSIHGNDDPMHMEDHRHSMHVHYDHNGLHHHMSTTDGMDDDGNGDGGGEAQEGMEGEAGHLSDNRALVERGADVGDQLTLSFQGQVYVFDSVSPEKVNPFCTYWFILLAMLAYNACL